MQYVIAVLVLLALGWAIYLFLSRRERDDDAWDADAQGADDTEGQEVSALGDRGRVMPGTVFDGPPMPAIRPAADLPALPVVSPEAQVPSPDPAARTADAESSWTWAADERGEPRMPASAEEEIAARTEALAAELPVSQAAVPDAAVSGDHVGEAAAEAVVLDLGLSGDAGVQAAQEEATVADAPVLVPAFDPVSSSGEVDPTEQAPVAAESEVDSGEVSAVAVTADPSAVQESHAAEIAARTEALAAELPVSQDAVPDAAVSGDHVDEAASEAVVLDLGPSGDAGVQAAQEEATVADAPVLVPVFDPVSSSSEVDPTEQAPMAAVSEVESGEVVTSAVDPGEVESAAVEAGAVETDEVEAADEPDVVSDGNVPDEDVVRAPVVVVDPERPASSSWEQTHGIDTTFFAPPAGAFGAGESTPPSVPESASLPDVEVERDVLSHEETSQEPLSEADPDLLWGNRGDWRGRHGAQAGEPVVGQVTDEPSATSPVAEAFEVEPDVVSDGDTPNQMVSEGDPNLGPGLTIPVIHDTDATPEPVASEPEPAAPTAEPVASDPEPAAPTAEPVASDPEPDEPALPERQPTEPPAWVRRISTVAEIRDGGFGVGSAAPFGDLAMPYGHPVKAWNDTRTYRDPDSPYYDEAEPHVWFSDDGAAERAGFRPAD